MFPRRVVLAGLNRPFRTEDTVQTTTRKRMPRKQYV
jgi:hypothetical protein